MNGCLGAIAVLLGLLLVVPGVCTIMYGTNASGIGPLAMVGVAFAVFGGLLIWGAFSGRD